VPSLFADLKAYYGEEGKRAVVEGVVEELKSTLESTGTLDGSNGASTWHGPVRRPRCLAQN
jgi:hypothetical protein